MVERDSPKKRGAEGVTGVKPGISQAKGFRSDGISGESKKRMPKGKYLRQTNREIRF